MKRMLFLAAALAFSVTALAPVGIARAGQDDPDRKKNSAALFTEAFRLETEKPVNLAKAIEKYKKAVDKAAAEESAAANDEAKKAIRATAASALVRSGFCSEKLEPEPNVADALASFTKAASDYGNVEKWGPLAQEKVSLKGVDVYLRVLASALQAWRDTPARSSLDLAEKKKAAREKIAPLDKDAVTGLVWGLGHADEIVRDLSADILADVVDGPGIALVIQKLSEGSADALAGSSLALQKIFRKFNEAADLDRSADDLIRDTSLPTSDKTKPSIDKLQARAADLKKKAAEIRHNIPDDPGKVPDIQAALEKIISNEEANPQARLEAAQAAGWIGRLSGPVAEAVLKATESKNRNVRQGAVRACRAVDPAAHAEKHKIAARLMEIVKLEPAKEEDASKADWANDDVVRQAAAEALESIALVKTLPALIEALSDNDAGVRHAAHRALRAITSRDLGYEADVQPLAKEETKAQALQKRQEAAAKWDQWWKDSEGIPVLVERFWVFQSYWREFPAVKLFDPAAFLREVQSRAWASADAKADADRAQRVAETFQKIKNVFLEEPIELGPAALDRLLKFIGGETERDGGKANPATRSFVAEACARIVEKHNFAEGVGKIRDLVGSGDTPSKKAGAAIALGTLPKDKIGASERAALVQGLGSGDAEVREACATALGRVGEEGNAADLTKAALDADASVQMAAERAITLLAPKNKETVTALSDLVAHEPDPREGVQSRKHKNSAIREYAVDALGAIADAGATEALCRASRDTSENVRQATTKAIQSVYKAAGDAFTEEALKILRDEKRKTLDRIGAALAIGDTGDAKLAKHLVFRLVDENAPRFLRDPDPEVRIAVCRAMARMKAKTLLVVERLLQAMGNEQDEREQVRNEAYKALKALSGQDPKEFKASDPKNVRAEAIAAWVQWFNGEKANLPSDQ
jgi:HEAT repeat protein